MIVRELITKLGFKTDEKSLKKYEDRTKKALQLGKRLAIGVGVALLGVGAAAVKAAGDMELLTTQFEVMLGSADKANKMMDQLKTFAAATPFQLNDLAKGATNLLAGGVAAEKVVATMRMLGDTAGGSSEKLGGLVLGYQKMMSTGKASLEVLNIFAERGVPIFAEMQKNLNISKDEFFKMVSAGKIATTDVTNAFKTMTSEGGMFYKGMEKASTTLIGLISTMKDNFSLVLSTIGKELLPVMKEFVKTVITFTQGPLKDLATELIKVLVPIFNVLFREIFPELIKAVVPILTIAGRVLGKILKAIAPVFKLLVPIVKLIKVLAPILDLIAILLVAVLEPLVPALEEILNALIPIVELIVKIITRLPIERVVKGFIKFILLMLLPIRKLIKLLGDLINSEFFTKFVSKIKDTVDKVIQLFRDLKNGISEMFRNMWNSLFENFRKLFELANKLSKGRVQVPEFLQERRDPEAMPGRSEAAAALAGKGAGAQTTLIADTKVTVEGAATPETANEIGKAVAKAAHAAFTIELKKILVEVSS